MGTPAIDVVGHDAGESTCAGFVEAKKPDRLADGVVA